MAKRSLSIFLLAAVTALLTPAILDGLQGKNITVTWGLENARYFREGKDKAAGFVKFKTKPTRFYTFTNSDSVHNRLDDCANRHFAVWTKYEKEHSDPKSRNRDDFQKIKRDSDPTCFAYAQEIAPTLYFDFETTNDDTYILKSIEFRTLGFEEYAGGGFTDNEAWYDIVVSHRLGDKTYAVDNKLTFKNKGRVQLRLWSDNYENYVNSGWITPMGAYFIKITFHFTHNGAESSVSTDPFQIDI
jgi:hypothetical protein